MYRQTFDCANIPLHLLKGRLKLWIEDLKLSRQFLMEDGAEEYFVVGHTAYGMLISCEGSEEINVRVGKVSEPCLLEDIRVVSSFFQPQEHKHAYDILPDQIEYRLVNP